MAANFDNITTGQNDAASSITISHTVSGINRLLVVKIHGEDNTTIGDLVVTSVTYAGYPLTFLRAQASPGAENDRIEMWYMISPPEGTADCVVTFTGALDGCYVAVESYTGIDQINPLNTSNSTSAISTGPMEVSVTTTIDDCLLVGAVQTTSSSRTITANSGQTEKYNEANTGQLKAAGGYEVIGAQGAYTESWTVSASSDWMVIAAAFRPALGGLHSALGYTYVKVGNGMSRSESAT